MWGSRYNFIFLTPHIQLHDYELVRSTNVSTMDGFSVSIPELLILCVIWEFFPLPLSYMVVILSSYETAHGNLFTAGDFNIVVSTTTARDMLIRINFQDGYRILDQTRLLMKYTDERSTESMNMTSEEAYMNRNKILLEVPHSRLPYERFRVDVALQVGDEVGPFVPDGRIHGKLAGYMTVQLLIQPLFYPI